VVLTRNAAPALVDLGETGPAYAAQHYLIDAKAREKDDISETKLRRFAHKHLIEPLAAHLKGVRTLIISPDGPLHALPFDALLDEGGKALIERYDVRMVQTGRALVARDRVATAKGFVGFGGIDFSGRNVLDSAPAQTGATKMAMADLDEDMVRSLTATQEQMAEGLQHLPYSGEEVDAIGKLYAQNRRDKAAPLIHKDREATEKALKALALPPRVLHLATHGAYLKDASIAGQPLLQSFVAMAGAHKGMRGFSIDGENGILHALEAQNLNLFGTELVVLSACQTGQGVFDYSEGLEGLPRAFYVAGAKNVLVTLWNVGDKSTKAFMVDFYDRWTRQTTSEPAKALQETKRHFMTHSNQAWRDPQIWAAFVLYEG
jgi:CHAT domain-containing protein